MTRGATGGVRRAVSTEPVASDYMRPLAGFRPEYLDAIDFVLTDIDDTLTSAGRLTAAAYEALERLSAAGVAVIPVTGRPAGWCDMIARFWPVAAVIGENGAFYFAHDQAGGMTRVYMKPAAERASDRLALDAIAVRISAAVPRARISADQAFREADLAIDFAEDGPLLSDGEIGDIVACFRDAGATAKISSIHVNGWFGGYDKLTTTRRLFAERHRIDIEGGNRRILFVGDSPNDEPMFGYFDNSVAVANFSAFQDHVVKFPRWITKAAAGAGFVEVADALLKAKTG